jgi:hypothetical protein
VIARCHCGAPSSFCADVGEHVGPDADAASASDRGNASSYDCAPRRDRSADVCDCDARNALFRSLGLPAGVCLPCTTRASRGLRANDATSTAARSRAA